MKATVKSGSRCLNRIRQLSMLWSWQRFLHACMRRNIPAMRSLQIQRLYHIHASIMYRYWILSICIAYPNIPATPSSSSSPPLLIPSVTTPAISPLTLLLLPFLFGFPGLSIFPNS